jgi:hypothetical protein
MCRLLQQRQYFNWSNYSVPETKAFGQMANYRMKEELRQQIRPTNVVIIIAGMWAAHSEWIEFELDYAFDIGKPILGVRPRGAQRLPYQIQLKADLVVNWNTESIVSGIRAIS